MVHPVPRPLEVDDARVLERTVGRPGVAASGGGRGAEGIGRGHRLAGAPPAVAYLVSFLTPPGERVHINDIVGRTAGTNEFTRNSSYSEPTPVSFAGKPVYVLTSNRTFSGGEEFAYDVKALELATLVGELTGGGANPTGPVPLPHGIRVTIPFGRAENPVTKGNWEGHGVDPDVVVPAADALASSHPSPLRGGCQPRAKASG